jgi:hypothetical protein
LRHCRSHRGARCSAWKASYVLAKALPGLLLAVAQLPLLAGAHVRALEVADENPTQVHPVLDLVARQVLEPRACGVIELEQQILDHEEIVGRPTGMAREPVVLEPHTGVVAGTYGGRRIDGSSRRT